jgi:hypothetical protein
MNTHAHTRTQAHTRIRTGGPSPALRRRLRTLSHTHIRTHARAHTPTQVGLRRPGGDLPISYHFENGPATGVPDWLAGELPRLFTQVQGCCAIHVYDHEIMSFSRFIQ